jgi:putative transposase
VHPSGYYAWCQAPRSSRARDDRRLTGLVKQYWLESGGVYGYRKVHADLRAPGETGGKHRVARLMRQAGLKAQIGYGRRPRTRAGPPAVVAVNRLQQRFDARAPNQTWVTDITYIRTHEGWLYLAVVLDLFSRQVVGWSMQSRIDRALVLRALLMAVWRRKQEPTGGGACRPR